jgi:ribosomal-protein-alanine N-acetyltransferase
MVTQLNVEDVFGDLPDLETERLLLRKMRMEDAEDLFAYGSDPEVSQRTSWQPHRSIEDSRAFLAGVLEGYAKGTSGAWGMEHRADHAFIGTCGISWVPRHARGELGYAMARPYWGQGLMTEAVRAVIAFGFERMALNRIEARCIVANIGSARVMEKNGMRLEGVIRQQVFAKGAFHDLKLYSILRREWLALADNARRSDA